MIDLSRFSSLYPQLASLHSRSPALPRPPSTAKGTAPSTSEGRDSVELNRLPDANGASFDRTVGRDAPVQVAQDGTYRPLLGRTTASAFSFRFNLQLNRQTTVAAGDGDATALRSKALETSALSYQAALQESERKLVSGMSETRRIGTDLFYGRTRELSMAMDPERAAQFEGTSQRVARTFQLSIRLNVSILSQFTSQSGDLRELDDDLFGRYLENTDGLTARSGEAVQAFFDEVGRILDATEAATQESLASFFDDVAATFGLSEGEAGELMGLVSGEVSAFFQEVDRFLADARESLAKLTGGSAQPAESVDLLAA